MDYAKIKTEYLCYLMNRAQVDAEGPYGYLKLCEILQDFGFFPLLEMDENRCGECRSLRKDFAEEHGKEYLDILDGLLSETGTLMELMVVLAEKMAYELTESVYEAGIGKWFKELLANCGLIRACNQAFTDEQKEQEVRDILIRMNCRCFGWDGEGSFFPLRWPRQDQRNAEVIIQMNNYIEENYDIC